MQKMKRIGYALSRLPSAESEVSLSFTDSAAIRMKAFTH
jgi:hypothetical protein